MFCNKNADLDLLIISQLGICDNIHLSKIMCMPIKVGVCIYATSTNYWTQDGMGVTDGGWRISMRTGVADIHGDC